MSDADAYPRHLMQFLVSEYNPSRQVQVPSGWGSAVASQPHTLSVIIACGVHFLHPPTTIESKSTQSGSKLNRHPARVQTSAQLSSWGQIGHSEQPDSEIQDELLHSLKHINFIVRISHCGFDSRLRSELGKPPKLPMNRLATFPTKLCPILSS